MSGLDWQVRRVDEIEGGREREGGGGGGISEYDKLLCKLASTYMYIYIDRYIMEREGIERI